MDHDKLEAIGEQLRSLGHDRREVVHEIMADTRQGEAGDARRLYRQLDRISEECIALMERQRALINDQLNDGKM